MEENQEILPDIKNIKSQETYTLPSMGLVYKPEEGIPASITLRRMTTKEDKIRMRNQGEDRIRKDLLQACIVEQGIDAGKLKLMDANFLLFRLRALSLLDDTYKVSCRCPHCGTEFIHQINLSEVPVKYMTEDQLTGLKVKLPISQSLIDFKHPSLNDIIYMGDMIKDMRDRFPNSDIAELAYTLTTTVYIDKVNGNTPLKEELDVYVDSLDIIDNRAVRDVIQNMEATFGFDENLLAICPNCNQNVQHGLPITGELFNPSK